MTVIVYSYNTQKKNTLIYHIVFVLQPMTQIQQPLQI